MEGCIVHIQLMKRAVPNHDRASITYRVKCVVTHFPVPQLVIPQINSGSSGSFS